MPESIPWLVANNRGKEAEEILRRAAKINKITLPESIFVDNSEHQQTLVDESKVNGYNTSPDIDENGEEHSGEDTVVSYTKVGVLPVFQTSSIAGSTSSLTINQRKPKEKEATGLWSCMSGCSCKESWTGNKDTSSGASIDSIQYEASICDLFKSPTLRMYTIALSWIW